MQFFNLNIHLKHSGYGRVSCNSPSLSISSSCSPSPSLSFPSLFQFDFPCLSIVFPVQNSFFFLRFISALLKIRIWKLLNQQLIPDKSLDYLNHSNRLIHTSNLPSVFKTTKKKKNISRSRGLQMWVNYLCLNPSSCNRPCLWPFLPLSQKYISMAFPTLVEELPEGSCCLSPRYITM